ncbi:MAG TPA: hypothetical protein VKT20_05810 [Candidatus Dormibacteraeota bacterium]|nr:hypothetical protein [Candidatus Dormibacteraeota bacterium]
MTGTNLAWRAARGAAMAAAVLVCVAACDLPFDLGKPTTRSLEAGVADGLGPSATFAMYGSYAASGQRWQVSAVLVRPDREDISVTGPGGQVEAILIGGRAYFRDRASWPSTWAATRSRSSWCEPQATRGGRARAPSRRPCPT